MKITAEPRSDQWNTDDFVGGSRTFTIAGVKPGKAEQKYDIDLAEGEGRVWRPPPTVVRLLIAAWGDESDAWIGRRVTLKLDDSVRFGPEVVGGIRISHLSHITKQLKVASTVKRGKKTPVIIDPLPDTPAPVDNVAEWINALNTAQSIGDLQSAWEKAAAAGVTNRPDVIAAKDARKKELT